MGMKRGNVSYDKGSKVISSIVWKATLLIFIYSMVSVMEGVISCVF